MERLTPEHVVYRALSVMVADPTSPLDRDERFACLCWLEGILHPVVILLPHDVAAKLLAYIATRQPEMLSEVAQALGNPESCPSPALRFDSPLENDFYLTWREEGLDMLWPLSPQHPVKDGAYRLDFAFPPLRVGIELDGYTYHSDREQFTKDRQRQREIEADGWRVIRFSGDELRADLARCVQEAAHFLDVQQQHHLRRKDDFHA